MDGSADNAVLHFHGLFFSRIPQCTANLLQESYDILYGGKMSDDYGWYLPFLYLDGYIDIHGPNSVMQAVREVVDGKVCQLVCEKLGRFVDQCASGGRNKCTEKFTGSYVQSSKNIYKDIAKGKTFKLFFFGFSEETAMIKRKAHVYQYTAISWPFSESNYMLQFTDALVVNQQKWQSANEEKKNAMREFITYFTGFELRRKIGLGEDLRPPRSRYLLQAIESFYDSVTDDIYADLYLELQRSVAAPYISNDDRKTMQRVLSSICVPIGDNIEQKDEL